MKLLLLVVMLVAPAALEDNVKGTVALTLGEDPRDLTDYMFTFYKKTGTNYVKAFAPVEFLRDVTICFRHFTDSTEDFPLFTLSSGSGTNALTFSKLGTKGYSLARGTDPTVEFLMQEIRLNTWQSLCVTQNSRNGVGQIWRNGKPSTRKFVSVKTEDGPSVLLFGQDVPTSGTSFFGQIRDIQGWDRVLLPCEIKSFMEEGILPPRTLLSNQELVSLVKGNVIQEKYQQRC